MRVLADNPELHGQEVPERAIDPQTTRLVTLHQVKPDGNELTVQTLMSVDTLAANAIEIWGDSKRRPEHRPWIGNAVDVILREALLGQSLDLSLPEMGAEGPADVIAIASCPPFESANEPGRRLVTSVFRHTANNVVDLEIQGQDTPIGTTSNHPFWSVDREAFIPAGDLRIGERLKQADGLHTHVTRIPPRRGPPTSVYNLEVDGQHVYHVGNDGLLVHNDCWDVAARILRNRPGGVIIHMESLNSRFVGNLPGFAPGGMYSNHRFHLENGILRDEFFKKGIPIDDWLDELGRINGVPTNQLLDVFGFRPFLGR
jgi:hypothetical protein